MHEERNLPKTSNHIPRRHWKGLYTHTHKPSHSKRKSLPILWGFFTQNTLTDHHCKQHFTAFLLFGVSVWICCCGTGRKAAHSGNLLCEGVLSGSLHCHLRVCQACTTSFGICQRLSSFFFSILLNAPSSSLSACAVRGHHLISPNTWEIRLPNQNWRDWGGCPFFKLWDHCFWKDSQICSMAGALGLLGGETTLSAWRDAFKPLSETTTGVHPILVLQRRRLLMLSVLTVYIISLPISKPPSSS